MKTSPKRVNKLGLFIFLLIRKNDLKRPFLYWLHIALGCLRLIAQWKTDSGRSAAVQSYSMDFSCNSCRYFSYCCQETFFIDSTVSKNRTIVSRNIESNDFPQNSKQRYFIHYDNESVWWQCWENGVLINNVYVHSRDFSNGEAFQMEMASQLQKEWI